MLEEGRPVYLPRIPSRGYNVLGYKANGRYLDVDETGSITIRAKARDDKEDQMNELIDKVAAIAKKVAAVIAAALVGDWLGVLNLVRELLALFGVV